jgi:predicted ArsR family transcriptional regulator
MSDMTDAKRRLVERLKRVDTATAGELAAEFELTDTAVRQHLEQLQELGLVRRTEGSALADRSIFSLERSSSAIHFIAFPVDLRQRPRFSSIAADLSKQISFKK